MNSKHVFPSTVLVEPTNKCNLACEFCEANCTVNGHVKLQDLSSQDLAIALKKIEKSITNIVFQGDCEPLVNKRLDKLVVEAKRFTHSVAIVTNGTLLNQKKSQELIKSGVNWFAFSIDDHRRDVFNAVRVRADLDVVEENLRELILIRNNGRADLQVAVHKIIFPNDTLESLKEFVKKYYLGFGVSQITFSPLVEMGDIKVKDWLKLRNRLESDLVDEGILVNLKEFCAYPYKTLNKYCGTNLLYVNHKGYLSPCGLHQRYGRFFGNLLQESYEEIAEKDHFKEYHNYWLSREYSKPIPSHCKDCFLLKGHYHRYTLNEGHQNGLEFCDHLDLQNNQADGADAIQYDLISKAL